MKLFYIEIYDLLCAKVELFNFIFSCSIKYANSVINKKINIFTNNKVDDFGSFIFNFTPKR